MSAFEALDGWTTRLRVPEFCHPRRLPALVDSGGASLGEERTSRLILAIRHRESLRPDARIREVRRWATRESASAWALALFELWRRESYASKHRWVLRALAHLGGEPVAGELAEKVVRFASSYSAREQRLVRLLVPLLLHVPGGTTELRRLYHRELPPLALAAVARAHAQLAPVQDPTWREDLAKLSTPKSLPGFVKKGLPGLEDVDGNALETSWALALIRVCAAKEAAVRRRFPVQLRAFVDEASLNAFAAHCVRCWEEVGGSGRYSWVVELVAEFGGDAAVLALSELVARWPNESETARKRALEALPAFRRLGSDTALLCLVDIRQAALKPSVIRDAEQEVEHAAADRKVPVEALLDFITPNCGLDEQGTRSFDFGSRAFRLHLDDHLRPGFEDPEGQVLDDLPEPNDRDDPVLAEEALADWQTMQQQLAMVLRVQSHRLEQDMLRGRRWSVDAWRGRFLEHPLMLVFTRRLLWGRYRDGALVAAFRVAEDLTLVDVEDEPTTLPTAGEVGLVHPTDLSRPELAAWGEQFGDYEIMAPFAQLFRGESPAVDVDRESLDLGEQASGRLRDVLLPRGWERDDAFFRQYYQKSFPGQGMRVVLRMDPGVHAGDARYDQPDQRLSASFHKVASNGRRGKAMPLGKVPALCLLEVVWDLREAEE
ncbi:MAG: DUF4132 domain-containing protein [Deltaproteobacteria bacterium]|nr:MAG: DUF4132 domain-containing protein [Deltaproteobacteria bacterium]